MNRWCALFTLIAVWLLGCEMNALAASCSNDEVVRLTGLCIQKQGLANAASCRREAEGANCGAQSRPSGCNLAEAKINYAWVFADAGAKNRFFFSRSQGLSPFDAILAAQAHNSNAQQSLRNCQSWVEAELANDGAQKSPDDLPNRPLSQADCSCITILPVEAGGRGYNVSSRCDAMDVSVRLVGDAGVPTGNFGLSTVASAGVVRAGVTKFIRSPAWTIVSIKAATLRNSASQFTCQF
jgi:hypothetical protein